MKIGSYVRAVRKSDNREFSGKIENVKKTGRGTLVIVMESPEPYVYNYRSFYVEKCDHIVMNEYRDMVIC